MKMDFKILRRRSSTPLKYIYYNVIINNFFIGCFL